MLLFIVEAIFVPNTDERMGMRLGTYLITPYTLGNLI